MFKFLQPVRRAVLGKRDGEWVLRRIYSRTHGGRLDLDNARTFTEKLFRRMVEYHSMPLELETSLVDKYTVRGLVENQVGADYLIPLLWHGESPEQIPFNSLPAHCIAKTTHGSGLNMRLRQPVDRAVVIDSFRRHLAQNYYWFWREAQYFNVKPRIVIEQLIDDGFEDGPRDYRFWCFRGRVAAIQVDNSSHSICPFYTREWELTSATYRSPDQSVPSPKPNNLHKMVEIAETLSRPFDFVRIDLYNVHGKIYFGEFTFTPTAGQKKFYPPEWDLHFGKLWS